MTNGNGATGDPQQLPATTQGPELPALSYLGYESPVKYRESLQNFNSLINAFPPQEAIDATPDGKAQTVVISYIESQLDMLFFGLWETENFKWSVIANEVVGSLDLVVIHPVTQGKIRRTGAACVQITVDKVPDELKDGPKDSPQEKEEKKRRRNEWALNTSNKKSNALDLTFPKLKAECLKNAAQSLGKCFGRDLNRKKAAETKQLRQKDKGTRAMDATKEALNSKS